MSPGAVYIHVPFCLHRCGYCDFTLVANRDQLIPQYLAALKNELSTVTAPVPVDTVFIGGGTPTHLTADELEQLFVLIFERFQLATNAEFSIEANPDGLTDDRLDVLQSAGVNRISLGVQSFDEGVLKVLERCHTPQEATTAIERCASRFRSVSLDLIFGVPSQSVDSWSDTLHHALRLPIQHISTYGLTYEQGTSFFRREQSGILRRTPDETERDMYLHAIDSIQSAGFEHYEVSNFARPGHQCRHNLTYWRADEYFAFGPGAASYLNGVRTTNCRSVPKWLHSLSRNEPCIHEREQLSDEDRSREAIMLGLRMRKGLHLADFEAAHHRTVESLEPDALRRSLEKGLLEMSGGFLRLTRDGLMIADTVVSDFL
jgi:oxygen-independent coproporphyrinogen-3 oxidase